MRVASVACTIIAGAVLIILPEVALPQTSTTAAPSRTGAVKTEMVPSLIVLNAGGATLAGQVLTLSHVAPNAITFADRPVRAAGHALIADVLGEWAPADGSFAKDPPNATVSVLGKGGEGVRDAVVELKNPRLNGDELTFDVRVLEGDLTGGDGPAAVFIDIIGMPWTPLSFAGVARRTAARAAWYGAAAAPYYPPPPAYYPPPPAYYPPPYYRPY
ncbi:MAG TPA: hypothetical protein VHT74_25100 [Acetobacteraceae bacterium]|jgi:hypothetical protein|nr:hypothetical protein [Acetobacteraceae bacterium]